VRRSRQKQVGATTSLLNHETQCKAKNDSKKDKQVYIHIDNTFFFCGIMTEFPESLRTIQNSGLFIFLSPNNKLVLRRRASLPRFNNTYIFYQSRCQLVYRGNYGILKFFFGTEPSFWAGNRGKHCHRA
jgi:hypothetical protein